VRVTSGTACNRLQTWSQLESRKSPSPGAASLRSCGDLSPRERGEVGAAEQLAKRRRSRNSTPRPAPAGRGRDASSPARGLYAFLTQCTFANGWWPTPLNATWKRLSALTDAARTRTLTHILQELAHVGHTATSRSPDHRQAAGQ